MVYMKNAIWLLVVFGIFSSHAIERPPLLFPSIESNDGKPNPAFLDVKKKSKPKIPTSWGGNALIQETKTINGLPLTTFALSGGAWIVHRKVRISSYHIEVVGEEAYLGYLKGGVRVEDKENRMSFSAGKGTYDKFQELIVLEERPTFYFYNSQNKQVKVTAPFIKRYMSENKTVLEGGVIMEDSEYTILTDSGVYYEKENLLVLENYPLIFGNKLFITGEKVVYNTESKITKLENQTFLARLSYETKSVNTPDSVKATKNTLKEPQKDVDEKKRTITLFTGDRIESRIKTDDEPASIGMYENARIYRDDFEYSGKFLKAFGEGYQNLEAKEDVNFYSKENNFRIRGKLFEHNEEKGYTHITDDPFVEFLSKEGEINSTMSTVELERFADLKEIVARGNVKIESNDSTIRGQYATYYEEEKKIIIEGNPSFERNGNIVRSGKIIFYPEENRMLLSDGLDSLKNKKEKK
jgi:lipopolysaccharide export system protein LptA